VDSITSGLTPDERRQLLEWPHGRQLFEHLRDQPGPLRLRDLTAYVHSLGYTPDLMVSKTLQGNPDAPLWPTRRHLLLGDKQGGPQGIEQPIAEHDHRRKANTLAEAPGILDDEILVNRLAHLGSRINGDVVDT